MILRQICRCSTSLGRNFGIRSDQSSLFSRIDVKHKTFSESPSSSSTPANASTNELKDKTVPIRKSSTIASDDKSSKTIVVNVEKETLFSKFSKKLFPLAANPSPEELRDEKYIAIGAPMLYVQCSRGFDLFKFLEMYHLPDTIDTWFRLTYLHVWMVLVRVSNENKDFFDDFRDELVPLLWRDCTERLKIMKKLPGFRVSATQIRQWVDNFYHEVFFGMQEYDEALLSDDTVLAAALWRNVFDKSKTYDVNALNHFAKYVRMHIYALHKIDLETLMMKGYRFRFPT